MQHDIEPTVTKRFRLPSSHPALAEIKLNVVDFYQFCRMGENDPATNIVGYDAPRDGMMTVYVACASSEVASLLVGAWD